MKKKRIGFAENKKCMLCDNMAMSVIVDIYLCPHHESLIRENQDKANWQ